MYKQSDRISAIKEIQKFLYLLSDSKYKSIPRVPIDGVFDDETKAAVIAYQKEKQITPSGAVDHETFVSLYSDYSEIINDSNTNGFIFGDGKFPLKEGDRNEDVRALNIIINELSKTYRQITEIDVSSYFSANTGDAIEEITEIFLYPRSRALDKNLYRRINEELNARQRAYNK